MPTAYLRYLLPVTCVMLLVAGSAHAWWGSDPDQPDVAIDRLAVTGRIDGANITFNLSFDADVNRRGHEIELIRGDVVLDEWLSPADDTQLRYDAATKTYYLKFEDRGVQHVEARFAARPSRLKDDEWRAASFELPSSQVRELAVACDRVDLEVRFPDAMRVESHVEGQAKRVTAVLGPGKPFEVQFKPQVQALDAKLVAGIDANIIATVSAAALRIDQLMVVDIAQGKLSELRFAVPESLSVTQVRGEYIRDWSIEGEGARRVLHVTLNRPQDSRYALQVVGEMVLPPLPANVSVPALDPLDGLRARGQVQVGTNSAIALVVDKTSGLSQIDNAAFARMILTREHPRPLPRSKAFTYSFTGMPFQVDLSLDDIVPSYDAAGQLVVEVKEDDLVMSGKVELDVRDAPVRTLSLDVPGRFNVAAVTGSMVSDYRVLPGEADTATKRIEVQFKDPVLGHTLIALRLELGRGPLDQVQTLGAIDVVGAKTQRGYLLVSAAGGVKIDQSAVSDEQSLKPVHTASVPMRVADAQLAYRYRDTRWTLDLTAHKKDAAVRVELLHLSSIGEGVVYGSVAANYFITGSPIDTLRFVIPPALGNVEFVGGDIINWRQDPDHPERWTVKLGRKVIGDYNLAVTYTQRYGEGHGPVAVGAVECRGVERQAGYVIIASQLNLQLDAAGDAGGNGAGLIEIDRDEVPANYRLLAHAPILQCHKYVDVPHRLDVNINLYDRGQLLPAVVEIMDLDTQLDVRDGGRGESITRVRYKVKNTSAQYLAVQLPPDARFRRVSRIPVDSRGNELDPQWVAASVDQKTGSLLIPLERNVNPNEPTTLELEYAQQHELGGLVGELALVAPTNEVPATFADWRISTEGDWSVRASGGMAARANNDRLDLAWVLERVGASWSRAIAEVVPSQPFMFAVPMIVLAWIAITLIHRAWLPDAAALGVLGLVLWVAVEAGGLATTTDLSSPPHSASAQFTQAVNVDSARPLGVAIEVVPTWREHVTMWGAVVVPAIAAGCLAVWLVMGMARRSALRTAVRAVALAAAVAGACYTMAQFEPLAAPLGQLLTWGVPASIAVVYLIWGVLVPLMRRTGPAPALASALVAGMVLFGGASAAQAESRADVSQVEHIDATLTAEPDSMAIDLVLQVSATGETKFPLLEQSAVLISDDQPGRDVSIVREDGLHYLKVERRGRYTVRATFLAPLAKADAAQRRSFAMPMPTALSNRVTLHVPGEAMEIDAPTAVRFDQADAAERVTAMAIFAPGEAACFAWQPRAREHQREQTAFFAQLTSLMRFDAGSVEGRHRLHFQVAQGELRDITVHVPQNMTVTAVRGEHVGAWRYEPTTHELDVRLSQGATGEYELQLTTHITIDRLPRDLAIGTLRVAEARRQRSTLGLVTSPSVYLNVSSGPQTMNVDDFARDAATLIDASAGQTATVRHAYRVHDPAQTVQLTVLEVQPELSATESATFGVADDRLIYNGSIGVDIAKAGLFNIELRMPAAYDIDALTGDQVSHWDESVDGDVRRVLVHFRQRTLGAVHLNLALSQAVTDLPDRIVLPRIELADAVKHTGQIIISFDRGVRLSVVERDGVSERQLDQVVSLSAGHAAQPVLAYKLLRPDWRLVVATEVVEPLVNVDFLHVADVSEGLVRHNHTLVYRVKNAGVKVLDVQLPENVLGLQILGANIARREKLDDGTWRVELTGKWYDRPYVLRLQYETQFDRDAGELSLQPVVARDVDQQRGYVVVDKADRVELAVQRVGPSLQPTDARAISGFPGAPDVTGAAFAYRSTDAGDTLDLTARRLDAARQLEATVLSAKLNTVVTARGESINRAQLQLTVGSKRNLETQLPDGAYLWSCSVNGKSVAPSLRTDSAGKQVLLVPLAQGAVGELPVQVDLIYVQPKALSAWTGRRSFEGPRFDLPLRDLQWTFYVPESFEYDDFDGTLAVDEDLLADPCYQRYDLQAYDRNVYNNTVVDNSRAKQLQQLGKKLAAEGRQYEARQALELGANYSLSDPGLNEDIRVDLHNLLRQQAKVGLVQSRGRLRNAGEGQGQTAQAASQVGDQFSQQAADQLEAQLDRDDNDNLEQITNRIIEVQEAAAGRTTQLVIDMPLRGRMLQFNRPLQVTPNTEMTVRFEVERALSPAVATAGGWSLGLFAALAVLMLVVGGLARRWDGLRRALAPVESVESESPDPDETR